MKFTLDPSASGHLQAIPESLALAAWYDSRPAVRRLWGIKAAHLLRVVVTVEATLDNSDVLPVWLANRGAWADELSLHTGSMVKLELLDDLDDKDIEMDAGSVIIADLYWRDGTIYRPSEAV